MDRGKFVFWFLIAIVSLAGFYVAYPFILRAVIEMSSCRGIGGACGAVATVVSVYLRPPVILVFCVFVLWIVARRTRFLGIRWVWTVICGLWLLGAFPVLVAFGNFWAANFSLGLVYLRFPVPPLFLLAFILFLIFADDSPAKTTDAISRRAWLTAKISVGYVLLLSASSLYLGLSRLPALSLLYHPEISRLIGKSVFFSAFGQVQLYLALLWICLFVFAGALAIIVLRQGRKSDDGPSRYVVEASRPSPSKTQGSFGRRKYT